MAKNDIRRHERPQLAPTGPIVTSVVDFRNFPPDGQPPEIARQAFFASQAFSKIAEVRRFSGSSETMLLYVFTKENTHFGPSNLKFFSAEPLIVARSRLSPLAR